MKKISVVVLIAICLIGTATVAQSQLDHKNIKVADQSPPGPFSVTTTA